VALILALLTAAGFQLRRDDPAAMKVRLRQHTCSLEPDVNGSAYEPALHLDVPYGQPMHVPSSLPLLQQPLCTLRHSAASDGASTLARTHSHEVLLVQHGYPCSTRRHPTSGLRVQDFVVAVHARAAEAAAADAMSSRAQVRLHVVVAATLAWRRCPVPARCLCPCGAAGRGARRCRRMHASCKQGPSSPADAAAWVALAVL